MNEAPAANKKVTRQGQNCRPILMSAPMVRAILEGRKTQTRRVVKAFPAGKGFVQKLSNDSWEWSPDGGFDQGIIRARCPYGQPGDRLWVRETFAQNWNQLSDTHMDRSYVYRADGEARAQDNGSDLPWRPSIHMPRRASRITLEITGVRVERLQEISEEDAVAEGSQAPINDFKPSLQACLSERAAFKQIWERINGAGAWDKNPTWVWVLAFTRVASDPKGADSVPKGN